MSLDNPLFSPDGFFHWPLSGPGKGAILAGHSDRRAPQHVRDDLFGRPVHRGRRSRRGAAAVGVEVFTIVLLRLAVRNTEE